MGTYLKKVGKWLLFFTPLLLGGVGLIGLEGEPLLDGVFRCVSMYVMNYQDSPPNLLVELARWTAPLATASGVLLAVAAVRDRLRDWLRALRGDSVAVYGSREQREELLAQLGRRGIDGGQDWHLVRAQNYLLLGSEEENFDFYGDNRAALAGRTVYLQCSTLPAQSVSDPGLRLFCPEETAARLFWKERCLYETSAGCGHRMQVVFVGFGALGEQLLTYALQNNIFSPEQRIAYHIFGDGARFSAVHTGLSALGDPVIFHREMWYEDLELLETAQMVVVLTQQEQLALVRDILLATTAPVLDVFSAGEGELKLLAGQERVRLFAWEKVGWAPDNIFRDTMFHRAKRINLRYAHLYSGTQETPENGEREWERLDGFTRYSNVSAADYHQVRLHMLDALGWPREAAQLTGEQMELLAELEHIRWCRYHYLNNWRQGEPGEGRRKDPARRIHADLVPYGALTDPEKQKDRDNIRVLLSVE